MQNMFIYTAAVHGIWTAATFYNSRSGRSTLYIPYGISTAWPYQISGDRNKEWSWVWFRRKLEPIYFCAKKPNLFMQKMIERERAFYRDYKTQQRQPHYLALCLKKAPWRLPRRLTVKLVQSSRSCQNKNSQCMPAAQSNLHSPRAPLVVPWISEEFTGIHACPHWAVCMVPVIRSLLQTSLQQHTIILVLLL